MTKSLILEKDKSRGLVPSRKNGMKDKAYKEYLDTLNPRENYDVQQALAQSPDPRFQEFLERIAMGRYRKISCVSIAKACGIDLKEFNDWWQRASTQRALAIAQTRSLKITSDIADDAESKTVVCERCDGFTWIQAMPGLPEETPGYRQIADDKWIRSCPVCNNGKVTKPGDSHARDKILEMSGLIQKGKGISIVQNFGGAGFASAVTALDDAMPTFDVDSESV